METIKAWIREMDPEEKKDLIESVIGWASLFSIAVMLSGICI